jgi:fatty acid desaturase
MPLNEFLYKFVKVTSYEFPPYPKDTGFYKDIRERVNKYFVDNKIDHKDVVPGLWRTIVFLSLAMVTNYLAFYHAGFDFFYRAILTTLFGIMQALPLLHVMHDCSHTAFGHSESWWRFWGRLLMDYYVGCSMTSWHNQHTIGHHIYTNVFKADPDLPKDVKGDVRRLVHQQVIHSFS